MSVVNGLYILAVRFKELPALSPCLQRIQREYADDIGKDDRGAVPSKDRVINPPKPKWLKLRSPQPVRHGLMIQRRGEALRYRRVVYLMISMLNMFDPKRFAMAICVAPILRAETETTSSGSDVAMPIKKVLRSFSRDRYAPRALL